MSTQYVAGILAAIVLAAFWLFLHIGERIQRARNRRMAEEWRTANPAGPPLTREERDAFGAWVETATLPAIILVPSTAEPEARGTRIGGPAWLAEGEAWPLDREGRAMEFIAQLDFGALPAIPDFPQAGLLQFFIAQGDFFGADFDHPDQGDIRLIWRPEPAPGRLVPPQPLDPETSMTPLAAAARDKGLTLAGSLGAMPPTPADWQVDARLGYREGVDAIVDALDDRGRAFLGVHHVGGHPAYTQFDYRSADRFADYDRTLLRLTSDNALMWGDMGEAAFTIRREDLIARRFDRAIFYWDCT